MAASLGGFWVQYRRFWGECPEPVVGRSCRFFQKYEFSVKKMLRRRDNYTILRQNGREGERSRFSLSDGKEISNQ